MIRSNIETSVDELFYNRPSVSATAGHNPNIETMIPMDMSDLDYNSPQVSVTSGQNTLVRIDGYDPRSDITLETKIDNVPMHVINPGSETGYHNIIEKSNVDEFIQDNKPTYSYAVPSQYGFKERNSLSHQPFFRERLQPLKSFGQISQSSGAIPMGMMEPQHTSLKTFKNRNNQKKINYRF